MTEHFGVHAFVPVATQLNGLRLGTQVQQHNDAVSVAVTMKRVYFVVAVGRYFYGVTPGIAVP